MAQLTLFQFNQLIKTSLQESIPPQVWIIAEIGELRLNQKGHCYMELVEKEGNFIQAKLKANIWAYTYRQVSSQFLQATGAPLSPGIKVLINASINFHEIYGISLTVNEIDPNYTLGERSKQREITIQKLQAQGALDSNKLLPLPLVPQHIAIISSETAAGYQDFIAQLSNNERGFHIKTSLFPALMQGNEAPQSIITAAQKVIGQGQFDLLVIIRGGGAQTDLDCFDDYELNAFLSSIPLPLITGIGHERDQTVMDLVAHTKLKTPTAVAEFILDGLYRMDDLLLDSLSRIKRAAELRIKDQRHLLGQLSAQLKAQSNFKIQSARQKIDRHGKQLDTSVNHLLKMSRLKLTNLEQVLYLNNPKAILKKGYTITLKKGKSIQKQDVNSGDQLTTLTAKGSIKSTVTETEND